MKWLRPTLRAPHPVAFLGRRAADRSPFYRPGGGRCPSDERDTHRNGEQAVRKHQEKRVNPSRSPVGIDDNRADGGRSGHERHPQRNNGNIVLLCSLLLFLRSVMRATQACLEHSDRQQQDENSATHAEGRKTNTEELEQRLASEYRRYKHDRNRRRSNLCSTFPLLFCLVVRKTDEDWYHAYRVDGYKQSNCALRVLTPANALSIHPRVF